MCKKWNCMIIVYRLQRQSWPWRIKGSEDWYTQLIVENYINYTL